MRTLKLIERIGLYILCVLLVLDVVAILTVGRGLVTDFLFTLIFLVWPLGSVVYLVILAIWHLRDILQKARQVAQE